MQTAEASKPHLGRQKRETEWSKGRRHADLACRDVLGEQKKCSNGGSGTNAGDAPPPPALLSPAFSLPGSAYASAFSARSSV